MSVITPTHGYAIAAPVLDESEVLYAFGSERPPSLARKFIELMIYATLLNSAFISRTGAAQVRGSGGLPIILAALAAFIIMLINRERLPISLLFVFLYNLGANISQAIGHGATPIVSDRLRDLVLWACGLVMYCYVVQNRAAQRRVLVFLAVVILWLVHAGGVQEGCMTVYEVQRLKLGDVGGMFANANSLAYESTVFAILLLFWSLRSPKLLRPILWGLAAADTYILILTVSRGASVLFACAAFVLLLAILGTRGVRASGLVMLSMAFIVALYLAGHVAGYIATLEVRYGEKSVRTGLYAMGIVEEMAETIILGKGPEVRSRTAGISPHHAFVYTHLAYGGITAWPFLLWLIILGLRTYRMVRAREFPWDTRMMVLAVYGMLTGYVFFNNTALTEVASMFGLAIIEKFTSPYTRRRMAERRMAAYYQRRPEFGVEAGSPVPWPAMTAGSYRA